MNFKVKDLSVSLSVDGASTCTSLTKPTGGDTLWFGWDASAKRYTLLYAKAARSRRAAAA